MTDRGQRRMRYDRSTSSKVFAQGRRSSGTGGTKLMSFWQHRTIDSLKPKISRDELRRRSRLLVIDDERPDLIDDLQHAGFSVDHRSDIDKQHLSVLDQPLYDAVLLDFGNVGTTSGSDQGLSLL